MLNCVVEIVEFVQCVSAHDEECGTRTVIAETTPKVFVRLCINGSTCIVCAKTVLKLLTPKQKKSRMNMVLTFFNEIVRYLTRLDTAITYL